MKNKRKRATPTYTPQKKASVPPIKQAVTDWHDAFLLALSESGNITASAQAAGISRKTAYNQRENDPTFAAQWDAAKQRGLDTLEDVANERARNGSDTLLIFLLKAHEPKRFRDNVDITSGGEKIQTITTIEIVKDYGTK